MASGSFDLGWEELLKDSVPSTQQVVEVFATDRDFESEPSVDRIFEEIERDAVLFESLTKQPADNTARCYGSPKSKAAVDLAMASGVPPKTHGQTQWSVRMWDKWAIHRNQHLLPGEAHLQLQH